MRTKLTSRLSLLFMSFAMLLAIPAVAFADVIAADADTVSANVQGSKDLGTVAPGATVSPSPQVGFWLECNGSNHLNPNQKADITFGSAAWSKVGGGSFSGHSANASNTSITAPSTWPSDGTNCNEAGNPAPVQSSNKSTATITAPTTPGTYNVTVSYNKSVGSPDITGSTSVVFTLTVSSKQDQTITFNQPSAKTYGAADFALDATASSGLPVSYSSSTTGVCTIVDGKVHVVSAGDCTVTASQAGNTSYNSAPPVSKTFAINKADLTVVTNDQTKKYGEANPALTGSVDGLQYSDSITASRSTTATQNSAVGNYPITATLSDPGSKLGNYTVTNNGGTLSVTRATATISLSNLTGHTYDGTAKAATATTTPAGLNGVSITYDGQSAAPKDAGSYAVVASLSNPNYEANNATGTLNIAKKALSVEANSDSREYGDANPAFTGTLSGVVNGDNISASYSTSATQASNVGTYAIVPSLSDPNSRLANYDVTKTDGTLTITKAPMTIKANDATREYGDANPAFTGSIVSGLKNNETLSVSGSSAATQASNVGTYAIVPALNGAKASNYDVTAQNGTLTVTAAPLSATANNDSREYGDANPTFTGTLSGVKNNDPVSASYSSAANAGSAVGSYAIVPSINATASVLSNYQQPVLNNGTLTVTRADLTVNTDDKSREYGDANPTFTGSIVGLKNNDPVSASYSSLATQGSDVGNYAITATLSDPGSKLGNYTVTNNGGTLTITAAPLAIKADNASRFYGDANPTFTGSIVSGLKNNDVLTLSFTTAATVSSPVGSYAIVPAVSGAKVGNYNVSAQNGTLTIASWTMTGFYQPVDMGLTPNLVKGGSTVPIKFELFKGTTELTDTASVNTLSSRVISCGTLTGAPDDIELLATGGTSLRYDATGGQYVYNWQTPKGPVGTCYAVTISAKDGSSSKTAYFKLK